MADAPVLVHGGRSTGTEILSIVIVMTTISVITVTLRLYTRFIVIRNPALEDGLIWLATLFSIATTISTGYEVKFGLGREMLSVLATNPTDIPRYFQSLYASIIVYNLGLLCTKLSILLQYLRICVTGPARKATYFTMGFVILYGIEAFFAGVFQCTPVAYFWNKALPGGSCVNTTALYYAHAGINIFTDFVILVLPFFILKNLQRPKAQKITLMGIIALGGLACVASVIRVPTLTRLSKTEDPTWDGPAAATWSVIELNVGISCASISTLRPLFARFLPKAFSSQNFQSGQTSRTLRSIRKIQQSVQDRSSNKSDQYGEIHDVEMGSIKGHRGGETDALKSYNAVTWVRGSMHGLAEKMRRTTSNKELPPLPISPAGR